MEPVSVVEDNMSNSWGTVLAGVAIYCSVQTPASSGDWLRYTTPVERRIGLRQPGEVCDRAADNKNVLIVETDADGVRISPQGRAFIDRKGLAEAVEAGVTRALELCGPGASARVETFIDPDDSSESLLIKLYASKPFKEVLADVRRFNIEWQRGAGAEAAFDDVLFMAGIE